MEKDIKQTIKKPRKRSLRALVEEKVKEQAGMFISSYAIRTSKETDLFHINDVCYARLALDDKERAPTKVAVSLGNSERIIGKTNMPLYRKYAKYILESPSWGLPFLTRNVSSAFRYGILMDVNQPLSRIMGSLTALREGVEFSDKLDLFDKMLKAKYSGDVAYFISSTFKYNHKEKIYEILVGSSGHKILMKQHSLKGVIEFFRNGYRDLRELPYTEEKSDFQCQRAVCEKTGDLLSDILKHCPHTIIDQGWDSSTIVKEKDLFKFADVLTKMIGKK